MLLFIFSRIMSLVKTKQISAEKYQQLSSKNLLWQIEDSFFNFGLLKAIIAKKNADLQAKNFWLKAHYASISSYTLTGIANIKILLTAEYALSQLKLTAEEWIQIYNDAYDNSRLASMARKKLGKLNNFDRWRQIYETSYSGRLIMLSALGMKSTAKTFKQWQYAYRVFSALSRSELARFLSVDYHLASCFRALGKTASTEDEKIFVFNQKMRESSI